MTTTISWTIDSMEVSTKTISGESEVVLTANWRCTGTDTTNPTVAATSYGSCSFPEPTTGGQFTPYAQLTQSQVVGWCWENGVNQEEIEKSISDSVAYLANPPVITPPLPWPPA